mmetsp:Transcript_6592/g.17899  ORF Transcript_6592/g.17899 Transcript_6592/m.17899 type:complete len:218 (+) Transcript_6592:658-1311(+)
MRDPGSVVSSLDLADLVVADLLDRCLVGSRVVLDRDRGRHAAHGESATTVADLDQTAHVGQHQRCRHGEVRTIGGDAVHLEFLDVAEEVVPSSAVESDGMFAQLEQNLLHLEGGRDGLQEDSGADGALWDTQIMLGGDEDVVPKPGLNVALELGQVVVWAAAVARQGVGVVEEVQREVYDASRGRLAIHDDMGLIEMPSTRPNEKHGRLLVERVQLA